MRHFKYSIITALILLALTACASTTGNTGQIDKRDLTGGSFKLVMVDGQEFSERTRQPFIAFDSGLKIHGRMCNQFTGQAELAGNLLTAPRLASTRMLCPEEDLNNLDHWFGLMLTEGATITMDGPLLTLYDQEHTLVFERE